MKVYWLCILLIAFSFLNAQLPPELADQPLPMDPEVLYGTLENGIKYYIVQNAKPKNIAELRLYIDAGSVLEDEDQRGLAHFTEHMAFNGTEHFEKSEVVDYLASIGMGFANGLNAMTSYDFTMYQLKIPTDNREQLEKGFLILSDMAHSVAFEPEELERERGVIIEEWRMGQGANERVSKKVSEVTFAGSRYANRTPIGSHDVLTSFGRDEIVRFYNDWYRPDLQSVLVIGDLPKEDALALVQEHFGNIPASENPRPREIFTVPDHPEPRAVVATDAEFPYSIISADWSVEPGSFQTVGDFYQSLHRSLFFTMLNSRLEELTKTEDPPFSFAYGSSGSRLKGLSQTSLAAYTGEGKNLSALQVLLTEAERVRTHGFLPSEFERAKINYLRLLEANVEQRSTKESRALVWDFFDTLMNGDVPMSEEHVLMLATQLIDGVQLQNINALVDDYITEDNLTISYQSIDKEGMVHPSPEQLLRVHSEVIASDIPAYEDIQITEPLMAEIPNPGKITRRKLHKASGIQEWTLSNGIKVFSKKTDFKADEVLFSAYSPGGSSRYDAESAKHAQLLGSFVNDGGVGDFDSNSLTRMMTGKIANLYLNVGTYNEGFTGSASPKDMEILFQLLYQTGTIARFDQKDLNSFITRMKPWLENKGTNPEQVFSDSLQSLTYNNHPMMQPLDLENLNSMELTSLKAMYNDRFGNYGDFSFFFVGNFDQKLLEEYSAIYLANLPVQKRKDRIVDAGIRTVRGIKESRFAKGSSESAYVAHVTADSFKLNDDNKTQMSAMLMVLNEKLRENIREHMSGVYAIQAWQGYIDQPKQEYTISIWMSCSPERVDELNEAIFATIDSIKAGAFEDRYVISSKAVLEKRYEENIYQNRYWMNNMLSNASANIKLDSFLDHPDRYARIDKKTITKAARKYLNFDNTKLSVIMVPEKSALNKE